MDQSYATSFFRLVSTTMALYVGAQSQATASVLWEVDKNTAQNLGDTLSDTPVPLNRKPLKK